MMNYFSIFIKSNLNYRNTPNLNNFYKNKIKRKVFNFLRIKDYCENKNLKSLNLLYFRFIINKILK